MKRAYANRAKSRKRIGQKRRTKAKAAAREIQLPLDRYELLNLMPDSLETLDTELSSWSVVKQRVFRYSNKHVPL